MSETAARALASFQARIDEYTGAMSYARIAARLDKPELSDGDREVAAPLLAALAKAEPNKLRLAQAVIDEWYDATGEYFDWHDRRAPGRE